MREIMISIQPQFVEKILNGEKTIEIRKTMPKCELPCKVYIYCTKSKPYLYRIDDDNNFELTNKLRFEEDCFVKDYDAQNSKVVAEFTLNKIQEYEFELWDRNTFESIGLVYYDCETGEREVNVFETDNEIEYTLFAKKSCLNLPQLRKYLGQGISTCYAWHIDNLKIYDKPKELSEFTHNVPDYRNGVVMYPLKKEPLKRPPQSWCYVEKVGK